MSQTNDYARVQALLASGRITEDEAEILFAALGEDSENAQKKLASNPEMPPRMSPPSADASTAAENDLLGFAKPAPPRRTVAAEMLGLTDVKPIQPPASAPAALLPHPPEPPRLSADVRSAAQPTQWLKLSGFCGDLSVEADASLSSPVVTGKAAVERIPEGYLIRTPPEAKGSTWVTRLHQATGDVRVRIPAEMGLDLHVAAGDGEVRGVKALKGTFTGGDFEVSGAETLDLTVTAGDVTLELCPQRGEQRLRATSGDVSVTFLAGSSVTVSGNATCGDLSLPNGFTRSGGFVGGSFEGTLGTGEAHLELRLTAGDVTIRAGER